MKKVLNFMNAVRSIDIVWKGTIIVLSTTVLFFAIFGWYSLIILAVMAGLIWIAHKFDMEVAHAIQQILSGLWKIYLYAWMWFFEDRDQFKQAQVWLDLEESESAGSKDLRNCR